MNELWISLKDVPAEGREFHFTDQSLWTGPMKEFGLAAEVAVPFEASMLVIPQDEGFLVAGSFSGSLRLACGRCVEDFVLPVSGSFESFETTGEGEEDLGGEPRLRMAQGLPEFDAAGFLWEQLLLALPESPVCNEDCKGLCPKCGLNRNQAACSCSQDPGDPRLAVLRNLKLS